MIVLFNQLNKIKIHFCCKILQYNGASPEECEKFGEGFDRPGQTRDGRKIIYPVNKDVLPGAETVYAAIGPRWANVANTLYKINEDETELNDLASKYPDVVSRLSVQWYNWARTHQVFPKPK